MDRYRKEHTYLVLEASTNTFVRWQGDNTLYFAGSVEDALIDLEQGSFYAIRVSQCSSAIQKEYEQRIDDCIQSGEIDIESIIPKNISVGVYYYMDNETNKPQFDTDEMRSEFESSLNKLEKISQ
jgi:hypothetical protein